MLKKIISILMLIGLTSSATFAEDFDGRLYIEDAFIIQGEQATLNVQLDNNIPIRAFEFKVSLPTGVTYESWELSPDRLPSGAKIDDKMSSENFENQVLSLACALNFGKKPFFQGSTGEIAQITVSAAKELAEGTYTVDVTAIALSDTSNVNYDLLASSFTLTVSKEYDKGYAAEVLPFALVEESETPISLCNSSTLSKVNFDVILPSIIVDNNNYELSSALSGLKYTTKITEKANGYIHVSVARKNSNVIASDAVVAKLALAYDEALGSKTHPISIKNITMTAEDGTIYHAAPYSTEIYAGTSPTATLVDGVATFHGNYGGASEMALLKAAMPTHATVDLTEVSALAEDLTATACDNVIVTADKVAYGREVSNSWGSICLPFAVESNDDIQFYALSGATSESLQFEKVASVEANTPAIFKAAGSSFCMNTENDGTFAANFAATQPSVEKTQSVTNWVMNGTYADKTVDVSSLQAYAISGNEVHKITETLNALAFRAWFQNNGAALGARLRLEEDATGIEVLESEDGNRVEIRFDLQGRQVKSGNTSTMTIENGKVIINK